MRFVNTVVCGIFCFVIAFSPEVSDRVVVIRNSESSHADRVQDEVMRPLQGLGLSVGQLVEFPVPSTDFSESVERLAEILEPGDRVISPAGDGTASLAVNAAILARSEDVRLGFLPYGNFNDVAATFTSRATQRNPATLLTSPHVVEAKPLQVLKDGLSHRYALLYANVGWTAQAAALFDDPSVRRALQSGRTGLPANMARLARTYFAQRATAALPEFRKDNKPEVHASTTDILAVNGPIMGRVIRSARRYYGEDVYLSSELDVSTLHRNMQFLGRSALNLCLKTHLKLPGDEVSQMELDFRSSAMVSLQVDGEYELVEVSRLQFAKDQDGPSVQIIAA